MPLSAREARDRVDDNVKDGHVHHRLANTRTHLLDPFQRISIWRMKRPA
jgi:hypothetical protein